MGLYPPDGAVFRSGGTCRMVVARRDQRMVSAARQTGANTAQCGFPDRMEHHLPLHGHLGRVGTDLRSPRP